MTSGGPLRPPVASLSEQIAAWERIVAQIEAGYRFGLDDWLNDMDLRRGIDDAIRALFPLEHKANEELEARLATSDRRFRRATVGAGVCLWGSKIAAREGWRADRQWWYFRKPRRSNSALDREITDVR